MVRRLVQQQQIGALANDQRQRQSRFFAAGKSLGWRGGHVAADVEAAEIIAQRLLARCRFESLQMPEWRVVGA